MKQRYVRYGYHREKCLSILGTHVLEKETAGNELLWCSVISAITEMNVHWKAHDRGPDGKERCRGFLGGKCDDHHSEEGASGAGLEPSGKRMVLAESRNSRHEDMQPLGAVCQGAERPARLLLPASEQK